MDIVSEPSGRVTGNDHAAIPCTPEPRDPDHVRMYRFDGPGAGMARMLTCDAAKDMIEVMDFAYARGKQDVQNAIREAMTM